MIGKILPHRKSFGPIASYALYGRKRDNPERVDWVALRNLDGVEVEHAHLVMEATARQSQRTKVPRAHVVVSWDHSDVVSPDQMAEIMDQTLADMGLAEHQALYVAHNDTRHKHVHAIINRVHPETHNAAPSRFERLKLRTSLMRQEREHGLCQTPYVSRGRHEMPLFSEIQMAEREGREARLRYSKKRCDQLREELALSFKTAGSWQALSDMLKRRGYNLVSAGRGVRIIRHLHYAKLSDVLPPNMKTKQLSKRWGTFSEYWKQKQQKERRQIMQQRQRQELQL